MKKNKQFCTHCMDDKDCDYREEYITETIDNNTISFLSKYYICKDCGEKIYGDLLDYNVMEANKKLREQTGLIQINEIEEILDKYNIGKKPLSLILGLGEITITRYLDGQNPTRENSELLKKISNNPLLYEMYLEVNKDKITKVAYKKSLGKTKQIELNKDKSKIYNTALYFVDKEKEIDPLELQKTIFFSNLFSKVLLKCRISKEYSEAWIHGPVYKDIYDAFSYYGSNNIDYDELIKDKEIDLTDEEKAYLDGIIKAFGYYNGSILREMTHLTDPWIKAREGLSENEPSRRIIEEKDMDEYAEKIVKEYNIKTVDDLCRYSEDLFNKARANLEKKNKM